MGQEAFCKDTALATCFLQLYTSASLQKHPNVTPSTDYLIDEGRAPFWSGPLQGPALNMASFKAYRLAYRLM